MLDVKIIKQLDSKNVSIKPEETKLRFNNLWNGASKEKKNEAVTLGGYKDTRAFVNAKNLGQISVRMTISIAIAFNVDPYWLTAESILSKGCTEDTINKFLKKYGFEKFCSYNKDLIKKEEIVKNISASLNNLSNDDIEKLSKIPDDDFIILFKSRLIKSKENFDYELEGIKALLLY